MTNFYEDSESAFENHFHCQDVLANVNCKLTFRKFHCRKSCQKTLKQTCFSIFKGNVTTGTVKLGDKERFDKEQIGVKEPFFVTKCQFTS